MAKRDYYSTSLEQIFFLNLVHVAMGCKLRAYRNRQIFMLPALQRDEFFDSKNNVYLLKKTINMMKLLFAFTISFLGVCNVGFTQEITILNALQATNPVAVANPFEVDSVNRKQEKFKPENLLNMSLSIPEQTAFTQHYAADTAGYFHVETIEGKASLQLISFYVHANRYGKANIKITSPNPFTVFVNDKQAATKTSVEDSLHLAKEATATCEPYPQTARVVVKLFAPEGRDASLKIAVENTNDTLKRTLSANNEPKRGMILDDVIKGKRVSQVSVSPQGRYVLISYSENYGERYVASTELYNVKTGRRVTIDTERRKTQLQWMPQSEKLC